MTGHLTPSPFSSCKCNSIEQEQPQHLSVAARVRSLVKQLKLSSSSSAARSNAEQQGRDQSPLQKPQMKKQTRKRVPASRPYQDRLHNMAEARREIVTMRHQQQSSKFQQQQPAVQVMSSESMPPAVAMSYASSSSSNNHHLYSSPVANLTAGGGAPAGNYSPSPMLSYDPAPIAINEEEVHAAAAAIGGQLEQLACSLPAQPLGLDLTSSFQGFGGALDNNTMISDDPFGVSLIQPSSCPAASAYYSSSPVTTAAMVRHGGYSSADASSPAAALSQALDGEMFYSIGGERQGMELSETTGNVWTKIFEGMESGGESAGAEAGTADGWPEWQWLCDGVEQEVAVAAGPKPDSLEMHVHDGDCHGGDHGGGDVALPCVVDVEGWDDGTEWFH